jgi:hypothetical protein
LPCKRVTAVSFGRAMAAFAPNQSLRSGSVSR